VLLHCTSVYPTADDELNLRNITLFSREFPGIVIGYSDHSLGLLAAPVAVGMGAALIEKHFTLDKTKPGFDNAMALTVDQLAELASACRLSSAMLGSADRVVSESEMKQRGVMRRSIFAARALKSGEVIDRESIQLKRPGTGLGPDAVAQVIGRSVSRDLEEGDPIEWDFLA
jgi:sialic acid synthase SpsE